MEYWANAVNPATAHARLPRVDRHHPAVLDPGRAAALRRILHLPVLEPVAEAGAEAASRVLHRRHRLTGDDRAAAQLGFGYSVVFIPTDAAAGLRPVPRAARRPRSRGHARQGDDRHLRLRRRERRARRGRVHAASHVLLHALRTTPRYLNPPPGYVTVPEFRKRVQAADVHRSATGSSSAINRIVAGTPEKVADAVGKWIEAAGTSA